MVGVTSADEEVIKNNVMAERSSKQQSVYTSDADKEEMLDDAYDFSMLLLHYFTLSHMARFTHQNMLLRLIQLIKFYYYLFLRKLIIVKIEEVKILK